MHSRSDHPSTKPPAGAVLAGGKSTRLGQDKAKLRLQDMDQLKLSVRRLEQVVRPVWVVGRDPSPHGLETPWIIDDHPGQGPAGGIASILRRTGCACLVTSCDLPFLTIAALDRLLAARAEKPAQALMTTYFQPSTGYIESLVAIYEAEALTVIDQALDRGCRKLSAIFPPALRHHLPYDPESDLGRMFFNINSREDLAQARKFLDRNAGPGQEVQPHAES
jgi:molybdopterin-guanine dinucleotide biosynthesis protein A